MSTFSSRFLSFMRYFQRKLQLFFNRQKIYLVDESNFIELFVGKFKNDSKIECFFCKKELSVDNVRGCFYDNKGLLHFFCDDIYCKENYERGN